MRKHGLVILGLLFSSLAAIGATGTSAKSLQLTDAVADMGVAAGALVLTFDRDLVGTQNFDDLLRVADDAGAPVPGGWILSYDERELRFTPVGVNTTYQVTVGQALAAEDGAVLGQPVRRAITTGDLQPTIGFASPGSVLPRHGTRGLPVLAVNTPQVDVQFFRVREGELPDFFAAYTHNGPRDSYDLDPENGWYRRDGKPVTAISESVYSHRFTLDCPANQRCINYLPIQDIPQLSAPGAYFAVMRGAGNLEDRYATSVFYVSDIGLHMRVYGHRVFVHAASLETGAPLAGVKLEVRNADGGAGATGSTDPQGNATLAYDFDSAGVLRATLAGDVALLAFNQAALDLSAFAVAGRRQTALDVFSWSGRDLYRPGETLRVSALLRDFDGRMVKPQPLFVRLKQPDGRTLVSTRLEPEELGDYHFSQAIPDLGPTGTWQVEFHLDPSRDKPVHSMAIHVEDFLPERLKLQLSSANESVASGQPLRLRVASDYLYGAPAAGNRFTALLGLALARHPVESLPDYWFGDPTVELPDGMREVLDAKLDDHGKITADIPLFQTAPPATPVTAIVSGSVYEAGGRPVTRILRRSVWPADALVGVRPGFDPQQGATPNARAVFELLRADGDGALLAAEGLTVSLQREHRRYHWVWTDADGWNFDYSSQFETLASQTVSIPAGASLKLDFLVQYGGYRLDVTDPATGLTMRFPFHAGWSWSDENRGRAARPDKVKLALDQTAYRAGDTLKVTVTPPKPGPGLLLVESDHLLYQRAIQTEAGATFEIPVTEDWMRHDVYITALVFRGGTAQEHTTPARAVGEVHVPIERGARKLALTLAAPDKVRPHDQLTVTVDAPQLAGQEARVTISAVDVGVLNITRFPVPDPFAWYFGQRAFGIDAYDVYGRIVEAFQGGAARLAYGGDMALKALPMASRVQAKQKIVDLFTGALRFDAKGHAEASLKMPEFNGALRITAVAFSNDRYGSASTETLVRAPIVLQASTPQVMAPGDASLLTVEVTNFTGHDAELALTAEAGPALTLEQGERTFKLAQGDSSTVALPIRAREVFGAARIDIRAASGDVKVHTEHKLAVRAPWPAVTRSQTRVLDTPAPVAFPANLGAGLIPQSSTARMTLTGLPPLPYALAINDLLAYRWRCLEQTISTGYAALLLTPEFAKALHITPPGDEGRRARVESALHRLSTLQMSDGHFNMWGSSSDAATFLTPYAADFLLDARAAGFDVNDQLLQKTLERLKDDLLQGGPHYYGRTHADHLRFAQQAYSAYVLARVTRAPLGTLRDLFDHQRDQSLTGLPLVHLGIALKLMGDIPRGDRALYEGFAKGFKRPHGLHDYGSPLRDMARMVTLTREHDTTHPQWDEILVALARQFASRAHAADKDGWRVWYSTTEEAALARLASQLLQQGAAGTVQGKWQAGDKTQDIAPTRLWSQEFDSAALGAGVRITAEGQGPVYVISDISGVPQQAPPADQGMIAIRRDYFTLDAKPWPGDQPLATGASLIVRVRIEAREDAPDALLTILLPGGLEAVNLNLANSKQWSDLVIDGINVGAARGDQDILHQAYLSDRYMAALDLDAGQVMQVFYLVRAVSPGHFTVPPPSIADMYRPELRGIGHSRPDAITVVRAGALEGDGNQPSASAGAKASE